MEVLEFEFVVRRSFLIKKNPPQSKKSLECGDPAFSSPEHAHLRVIVFASLHNLPRPARLHIIFQ